MRHQSPSPTEEADRKHGQGVHSREAERTADLSGLHYPTSLALQFPACQKVSGPQQLLGQLHRFVPSFILSYSEVQRNMMYSTLCKVKLYLLLVLYTILLRYKYKYCACIATSIWVYI